MPFTRFQFTFGQFAKLTVLWGLLCMVLRPPGAAPYAALLLFPAIESLVRAPIDRAMGIGGGTLVRCVLLIGLGIAYYTYFAFFPDPSAVFLGSAIILVYSVFLAASLWKVLANRHRPDNPRLEDSCGPITWKGFGGTGRPES
jgi:hypothetical protein